MGNRQCRESVDKSSDFKLKVDINYSKKNGYASAREENALESTVIWIGKDSETQPNKYLEECNTHQCGE